MSDDELQRVIGKARRLKELRRAKERVRQLERELRGEPAKPQESIWVPEFLRVQVSSGRAQVTGADVTVLRVAERSRALTTTNVARLMSPASTEPSRAPSGKGLTT
jgi:hypothetical protein